MKPSKYSQMSKIDQVIMNLWGMNHTTVAILDELIRRGYKTTLDYVSSKVNEFEKDMGEFYNNTNKN